MPERSAGSEPPRPRGGSFVLIDSHAHLTDPRLAGEVAEIVARAREAGVARVVTIGTDLEDSRAALALAAAHEGVFASVGIHPHAADTATPQHRAEIEALARTGDAVAIGETGLDYHYDNAPRDAQQSAFAWQLELGRALDLAVVVHAREADDDVRALLREAGAGTRGVLHCFSSGRALLEEGLALGWYVSFSGMVTFRTYADADLVRAVPLDRLLVETDSPYLAPVPHRGKRNEPAHVAQVAARVAELRGEHPAEVAEATTRNARDLYRLG